MIWKCRIQQQGRKAPEGWDPQTRAKLAHWIALEIRNGCQTAALLGKGEDSPQPTFFFKNSL